MIEYTYKITWLIRGFIYSFIFKKWGRFCYLGKPLFLSRTKNICVGEKFRCFPGARLEVINCEAELTIGCNVAFAQNVHITCGELVVIGDGTSIAANTCITDINHNYGSHTLTPLEQGNTTNPTFIGRNCFIGFGAVINAGTRLQEGCIVGANAYVQGSFPAYSVIAGNPGKTIKRY